nr:E3 ubiquitin-protein ligase PUB24-like [Ipomoea batatas]
MCPISLQIMKDPVTAASGITYDRDSIEKWLSDGRSTMCPVTKQPLPRGAAELTPNHTLQRLIQSWSAGGVRRIPPPNPPITKAYVVSLVRALSVPILRLKALQKLDMLAAAAEESERNRKFMAEAGVVKEMLKFVVDCYKDGKTAGLEEALNVLYLMRSQFVFSSGSDQILDSILWILDRYDAGGNCGDIKRHALCVLRTIVARGDSDSDSNSAALERLKPDLLKKLVSILRDEKNEINLQGINAALHVISAACQWGRNRVALIESDAVFELIEVEINNSREKKTTELVLGILSQLCCCADGRAQLLSHAAGIAVVSNAILKVSARADDEALAVLSSISRFSATSRVIGEMLRVGTVAKLCMVLQANCASYLKDKAREILRSHSDIWKDSPCVDEMVASFTRCATT